MTHPPTETRHCEIGYINGNSLSKYEFYTLMFTLSLLNWETVERKEIIGKKRESVESRDSNKKQVCEARRESDSFLS